jgi:hypothetical protein
VSSALAFTNAQCLIPDSHYITPRQLAPGTPLQCRLFVFYQSLQHCYDYPVNRYLRVTQTSTISEFNTPVIHSHFRSHTDGL